MKITVNSYDLAEAVNKVAKACAVKDLNGKILEGIKLSSQNDKLTLTATDVDMSIETSIRCETLESGVIVVAGKIFAEYVNKVIGENLCVDISLQPNGQAKFTCGKVKFLLSTMDAEQFPSIKKDFNENCLGIKVEDFKKVVARTSFCCAIDEARPILKGCLFDITADDELTVAALDGYRLGVCKASVESFTGNIKNAIVPGKALTEMVKLIGAEEKTAKIYLSENQVMLLTGETLLTARLFNGRFVDYNNLLNTPYKAEIFVNREDLISALDRMSILAKTASNLISVKSVGSTLKLTTNNEIGDIEEELEIERQGNEIKIRLNYKYLLDALKAIDEEKVRLCFNTESTPMFIRSVNEENRSFDYLVMPVRSGR